AREGIVIDDLEVGRWKNGQRGGYDIGPLENKRRSLDPEIPGTADFHPSTTPAIVPRSVASVPRIGKQGRASDATATLLCGARYAVFCRLRTAKAAVGNGGQEN
ncbi:hypothetical protein, partial [Cupriavidus sp.]